MEIKPYFEPESGTWTYLLADEVDNRAAIIDPVWVFDPVSSSVDSTFIEKVMAEAQQGGRTIEWVLETHAHADHLTAADFIRRRTGAKIACGGGIREVQKTFTRVFNMDDTATDGSQFDRLLAEGDVIALGQLQIRVMQTPGHTSDSVTYHVRDAAFIGDTLFSPTMGSARCDFPGGSASQLYDSIRKLYQLPAETRLFLCHDYPAKGEKPLSQVTVAESMERNIHMHADTSREDFVALRTERDKQLGLPKLIFPSLQVNILAGRSPEPASNGVSYLQTPFNRSIAALIKGEAE